MKMMVYFPILPNQCFCTIWQNTQHENRIFALKCYIRASLVFNQSLLDFFNLVDLQVMLALLRLCKSRGGTGSGFFTRDPTRPGR